MLVVAFAVFCYYEQAAMQVDQRSLIDAKQSAAGIVADRRLALR
jgi:hypothetical protein